MRTYNVNNVQNAINLYKNGDIKGLDLPEWLANSDNIALINPYGDIAMFEHQDSLNNGTYLGHYFFFSRGKKALESGKRFLKEIFNTAGVKTVAGITPIEHKGALWLNKKLGFKERGMVDTEVGQCMFVMQSKKDWESKR